MESVILEISLCLIENTIIYVFLNSLLKNRFASVVPMVLAILITSIASFFYSGLNMFLKMTLAILLLFIGTSVLYKEKFAIRFTYSLISLYAISIIDIIFGNILSLILNKDITDIFFNDFTYRVIFCLIIKISDALIFVVFYKMLNKVDKYMRSKFWSLFAVVVFVLLAICTVFLYIYPSTQQNTASTALYTALSTLFFVMSLIIVYFFTELSKGFQRDSKLFLLENNFSTLQEQIAVQQQSSENVRKLRHDMNNHLANIRSLIDSGVIAGAAELLDKTAEKVNRIQTESINTGNSFADAILLSKTSLCRKKNIDFTYSVQPLEDVSIDVVDLSSLLSNLLDNAIESAVQTAEPFVRLTIVKYNAYYTLCVENSYKGKEYLKESGETLITTKSDKALHGYGTQIISDIAQKYDGSYLWEAQENKFVSTVLIKI